MPLSLSEEKERRKREKEERKRVSKEEERRERERRHFKCLLPRILEHESRIYFYCNIRHWILLLFSLHSFCILVKNVLWTSWECAENILFQFWWFNKTGIDFTASLSSWIALTMFTNYKNRNSHHSLRKNDVANEVKKGREGEGETEKEERRERERERKKESEWKPISIPSSTSASFSNTLILKCFRFEWLPLESIHSQS